MFLALLTEQWELQQPCWRFDILLTESAFHCDLLFIASNWQANHKVNIIWFWVSDCPTVFTSNNIDVGLDAQGPTVRAILSSPKAKCRIKNQARYCFGQSQIKDLIIWSKNFIQKYLLSTFSSLGLKSILQFAIMSSLKVWTCLAYNLASLLRLRLYSLE